MNPKLPNELSNLKSLQVEYDNLLQTYNRDMENFIQEAEKFNLQRNLKQKNNELSEAIRKATLERTSIEDIKLDKSFLFSDDSLVKAIFTLEKRAGLFEIYPDMVYWGQGFLSHGMAKSAQECLERCQAEPKCSGAWFQNSGDGGWCQLRQGMGSAGRNYPGRQAIMNKLLVELVKVKKANFRLLALNKQISAIIEDIQPNIETYDQENQQLNDRMSSDHLRLLAQKMVLDNRIRDYDNVNVSSHETERLATSNLLNYRIYLLILVAILLSPMFYFYGLPTISITGLLIALVLMVLNMKSLAFYTIAATIIYMAYSIPLESPI